MTEQQTKMSFEDVKPIIQKVERLISISIQGNQVYEAPFIEGDKIAFQSYMFLNNTEFVKGYFPDEYNEDPDHDYELRIEDNYYITTLDGGQIYLDSIYRDDSGQFDDIDIAEESTQATELLEFLKKGTWDSDDLNNFMGVS